MEEKQSKADLLALRGGLRGRFRRVFDGMENAFEVLLDDLCINLRRRNIAVTEHFLDVADIHIGF